MVSKARTLRPHSLAQPNSTQQCRGPALARQPSCLEQRRAPEREIRWADATHGAYDHIVKLKIVLEPSDEGGYTVFVPSLPGCISEGETREEALTNIREAIELYLDPSEAEMAAVPGAEVEELVV